MYAYHATETQVAIGLYRPARTTSYRTFPGKMSPHSLLIGTKKMVCTIKQSFLVWFFFKYLVDTSAQVYTHCADLCTVCRAQVWTLVAQTKTFTTVRKGRILEGGVPQQLGRPTTRAYSKITW